MVRVRKWQGHRSCDGTSSAWSGLRPRRSRRRRVPGRGGGAPLAPMAQDVALLVLSMRSLPGSKRSGSHLATFDPERSDLRSTRDSERFHGPNVWRLAEVVKRRSRTLSAGRRTESRAVQNARAEPTEILCGRPAESGSLGEEAGRAVKRKAPTGWWALCSCSAKGASCEPLSAGFSGHHNFARAVHSRASARGDSELIGQLDQVRAVHARVGAPLVAALILGWQRQGGR